MKIKYKAPYKLTVIDDGDWIDLRASEPIKLEPIKVNIENGVVKYPEKPVMIPLGIAMYLPDFLEAHVLPRSSTYKSWGITMANGEGIIDHTYRGNNDIWHFPAIPHKERKIYAGDRICQFKLEITQKASVWQKLRWFFTRKVEFVRVEKLNNKDRKGFGSTGTN